MEVNIAMNPLQIECKNVSFAYQQREQILEQISFSVVQGETIGIIGANGAGKSTLLRLLVGLEIPNEGELVIDGIQMKKANLAKIRQTIGYVFQDSDNQVFMTNVYDELAFAPRNYGYSDTYVKMQVEEALNMVGILHLKNKPVYTLSGGEKKLVAIATILAMKPQIILMDEPTIALDPKNRRHLIKLLNRFEQSKLITSHDLDMLLETCHRIILLGNGKIIKEGRTREILMDQELLEQYGLEIPLCMQNIQWKS